ncbi:MAG: pyridoxine 5'-phosphate synthase [Rickettsiales bacterium]|nr:pyridoxine 5'-phosphate synthase [Rickettsiales bacterium]
MKLGVNIDHIATLRNARGEMHPSILRGAETAMRAGADGITIHLREDRRHIKDKDVFEIKEKIPLPLNFECAATDEMLEISLKVVPNSCCLVPEKREELTTEGGLDVIKNFELLKNFSREITKKNILPSFFIDADLGQLRASKEAGAKIVEFHTGKFCRLIDEIKSSPHKQDKELAEEINSEFEKFRIASLDAEKLGIICHAGHGLNYNSIPEIIKIPQIIELNIGHFIIGEAIFEGLPNVIKKIKGMLG